MTAPGYGSGAGQYCPTCKAQMRLVWVWDTGSEGHPLHEDDYVGIACNMFACDECGTVARENVWDYKGVVVVRYDAKEAKP